MGDFECARYESRKTDGRKRTGCEEMAVMRYERISVLKGRQARGNRFISGMIDVPVGDDGEATVSVPA